jgi:small subunit ribosomal protein S9
LTETETYIGTGRRKCAVARVRIKHGKGDVVINGKPMEELFTRQTHQNAILFPLRVVGMEKQFDVWARINGGGLSGWADALKLGIARALEQCDPGLRHSLKVEGCLRRDPREKERKKYGQKRARKKFQFSKR